MIWPELDWCIIIFIEESNTQNRALKVTLLV
jgi:hypothetical protein